MCIRDSLYTFDNPEYRKTYWHTCSHVLAQAMKRLHPEVKLAIGPSIENGFYYDFDTPRPFTPEDLEALEAEMRKICKEKLKLERFELPREEAIKFMEEKEEPYKVAVSYTHLDVYKRQPLVGALSPHRYREVPENRPVPLCADGRQTCAK